METRRFPLLFEKWYAVLSSVLLLPPCLSWVEVGDEAVRVRMGWAFHARFPRSAVASAAVIDSAPLSRGVHGFAGRWLVNGAGRDILAIELVPDQRAYVLGFPVRLRQLLVSVGEHEALAAALLAA